MLIYTALRQRRGNIDQTTRSALSQ